MNRDTIFRAAQAGGVRCSLCGQWHDGRCPVAVDSEPLALAAELARRDQLIARLAAELLRRIEVDQGEGE